jgi:hypothetical protein
MTSTTDHAAPKSAICVIRSSIVNSVCATFRRTFRPIIDNIIRINHYIAPVQVVAPYSRAITLPREKFFAGERQELALRMSPFVNLPRSR